jgi:hypothetical protein
MSIVVLQLADVKRQNATRPTKCPHCAGTTFQRWGAVRKPVRDPRLRSVKVYRYRCCHCRHTFRHYPQGVDQADQTHRLRNPSTSSGHGWRRSAGPWVSAIAVW